MDMLSDGELFRMQQDAIERARQTARLSPSVEKKPEEIKTTDKNGLSLSKLLGAFKGKDNILVIGILALLLTDGCEDELLILALIFLLLK